MGLRVRLDRKDLLGHRVIRASLVLWDRKVLRARSDLLDQLGRKAHRARLDLMDQLALKDRKARSGPSG